MKLQNLAIIFLIIFIPVILIFSYYIKLEISTIKIQTDYDSKFISATQEALEAFEINTLEWNSEYSTLANSKRRDITASINTFVTSLANKLGIGGTNRQAILQYIPAIVYTMYDGYYIYTPTYVPQTITNESGVQLFYYPTASVNKITSKATQNIAGETVSGMPIYVNESGTSITQTYDGKTITFTTDQSNAKKTYKHVLKTFVPYTGTDGDYVINYTLGDYIRVYGKDESREGQILEDAVTVNKNSIDVKVNNIKIEPETLSEYVAVNNGSNIVVENYQYICNSNNDKRYYDNTNNKFFTINKYYEKVYLPEAEVGSALAEYKSIAILQNSTEYIKIYQLLNKNEETWYYLNENEEYIEDITFNINVPRDKDCSAINYYIINYSFNNWLEGKIDKTAVLNNRLNSIIDNINNNLNLSMSNYSENSKINYKLPEISYTEWEQALSNVSILTFFQGAKVGLKTYNNYAVVTSTENNEFIQDDSLYYIDTSDEYYHRYGCSEIENAGNSIVQAYLNTDFKAQSYENEGEDELNYYYKHAQGDYNQKQCYNCIVNRNIINENSKNKYNKVFYEAIARERYIQIQRTMVTNYKMKPCSEHIYGEIEEIPSTCTTKGRTQHSCTKCGTTELISELPLAAHIYGNIEIWTLTPTTKAVIRRCTRCGNIMFMGYYY